MSEPEDPAGEAGDPSLQALLARLVRDGRILLAQEFALLREEIALLLAGALAGAQHGLIGALLIGWGALALTVGAALGLATLMAAWIAWMVVGGVVSLGGIALAAWGRRRLTVAGLRPARTLRTLAEARAWAEDELR